MGKNRKKGRAKGEFHSKQHQQNLQRQIASVNNQIASDRRSITSERPIIKLGSLRGLLSLRTRDDAMERQYAALFQPGASVSKEEECALKRKTKKATRPNSRPHAISGMPSLVSLCIASIVSVFDSLEADDDGCVQYFQLLPSHIIEGISSSASEERTITDDNIKFLCAPNIKHLYLSGGELSDLGLRKIFPRQSLGCQADEQQDESLVQSWEEAAIDSWEDESCVDLGVAFEGCCKLIQLDLQSVPALDLAFMQELVVRLPTLRHLALRDCFTEGTGHTALIEHIPCLQRLRTLDLRDNGWIDDECLCLFAAVCSSWRSRLGFSSRLLILKLAGCDDVTKAGTHDVLKMSFPELRRIEYEDEGSCA
jgi:hypothetical protein